MCFCLCLMWGDVADGGVDPRTIVIAFDIGEQFAPRGIAIGVFAVVDQLGFQSAEEALHRRIVPAIRLAGSLILYRGSAHPPDAYWLCRWLSIQSNSLGSSSQIAWANSTAVVHFQTSRVRSLTRHSRSRLGRLASSSSIVGTRTMLQSIRARSPSRPQVAPEHA